MKYIKRMPFYHPSLLVTNTHETLSTNTNSSDSDSSSPLTQMSRMSVNLVESLGQNLFGSTSTEQSPIDTDTVPLQPFSDSGSNEDARENGNAEIAVHATQTKSTTEAKQETAHHREIHPLVTSAAPIGHSSLQPFSDNDSDTDIPSTSTVTTIPFTTVTFPTDKNSLNRTTQTGKSTDSSYAHTHSIATASEGLVTDTGTEGGQTAEKKTDDHVDDATDVKNTLSFDVEDDTTAPVLELEVWDNEGRWLIIVELSFL